jgi:hypothetical protein
MKLHSKIAFENRLIEKLYKQLPKHDFYYQQLSPQIQNWTSLYWQDYKQSTRYTYIIDKTSGENHLWNQLKGNVRRNISKAKDQTTISSCDMDTFWSALSNSFSARNTINPFNKTVLFRLFNALNESGNCTLNICKNNSDNTILAGNLIAHDKLSSYYVCGFFNPQGKELGGLSYLLWHNILNCPTEKFDFEGSMLQDIEYFFRAFGGQLVPHYRVWKVNSPLLRLLFKFRPPSFIN